MAFMQWLCGGCSGFVVVVLRLCVGCVAVVCWLCGGCVTVVLRSCSGCVTAVLRLCITQLCVLQSCAWWTAGPTASASAGRATVRRAGRGPSACRGTATPAASTTESAGRASVTATRDGPGSTAP